jgi:hypothetical protein
MCCAPSSANPQANQRWQAHAGLIDSWGDPHQLPHPYAWRWIGYHLAAAGHQSQLDSLLLDYPLAAGQAQRHRHRRPGAGV